MTPPSNAASAGGPASGQVTPAPGPRGSRQWVTAMVIALLLAVIAAGVTGQIRTWLDIAAPAEVALVILVVAAILWVSELIPLFVTSLVILVLEVVWLAPVMNAHALPAGPTTFSAPFFSNVILLFLGGLSLSAAFSKFLIAERLARWVLVRTGQRPARVLLGVIITTAFLSMWMSNTATAAMMLGLAMPLLSKVAADDPFRRALVLAIAFSANLGGLGTPIGTPPNAIAMGYMAKQGMAPSFGMWMLLAAPVLLLALLALWLMLLRMFPARARAIELAQASRFQWSWRSRLVVAVSCLTALFWLTGGLHGTPSGIVALVPVIVFFGARLLTRDDLRRLSWDVLILAGGGLSLGVAVEQSGLGIFFVSLLDTEGVGFAALAVPLAVTAALMTSIMSNTATANLLIPVVLAISGVPLAPLLLTVAYTCSCIMVLPVSTPPNAMVFGSGMIRAKDMFLPGAIISAIGLGLTLTLGMWWWGLLRVY